jgi:glycosyltransferase involved in cell wall biosynthesis
MHVLHYIENFLDPIGGGPIFVRGLTHHLQKYGIDQSVITDSKFQKTEITQIDNVAVFSLPTRRLGYYTILSGLFNVLKNGTFDVINIHGFGTYIGDVVCILKKLGLLHVPLVLTTHGIGGLKFGYLALDFSVPFTLKRRIRGLVHHFFHDLTLGRLDMNTFDKVIFLSEEERKYLSKLGLKNEKSVKIPIAINEIFFNSTSIVPTPNRDYILYVGRIDPYKGLDTLVKAIKELRLANVNLKCIIIGKDCGYVSQLESLINQLGIADLIEIKDYISQENLLQIYSFALVTILVSESEGFPLALVESVASGTPFIATPVGAIPELVDLTKAGILVPIDDPKALARTIRSLLEDKDLFIRLSTNGKNSVTNFTWENIAKRYYEVYLDVINNNQDSN